MYGTEAFGGIFKRSLMKTVFEEYVEKRGENAINLIKQFGHFKLFLFF